MVFFMRFPLRRTPQPLFKLVWSWKGPTRYKAFLCTLVHNRLLTNEEWVKRGMASDDLCPRCLDCPETIMHVLRDCEDVKEFWMSKLNPNVVSKFSVWVCTLGLIGVFVTPVLARIQLIGKSFLEWRCMSYGEIEIIFFFQEDSNGA